MPDRPLRILELRSVRGTGGGPEKTILLGASQSDPRRFLVTVCYIRDLRDRVFALDHTAARLGLDYVEVPERHSFDPAVWPALRRLTRERQIDIVHSHDYKTDALALMLRYAEGTTPLSTVHGWSSSSLRETLVYYPADRQILRRFPRVIAVSSRIRDGLVRSRVRADRVEVVPNGIDPSAFRRQPERVRTARAALNLPDQALIVGAAGRLERVKRFDVLIDAVARLRAATPDVHVVIAGTGTLAAPLAATAAERGLGSACHFVGHLADVSELYHASDVFVQSSDTEGTPNAVLEAMALETPVVATDVGGTRDLIVPDVHGLLVARRDPAALADAIRRTFEQRAATASRVAAARRRIETELSFEQRMQSVERIYGELADGPAAARSKVGPWVPARGKR